MRLRNLSKAFYALGLFVGGAASMGLLVGFEPARLPAALLNIAAYKLTFLAALFLIAAGAGVARFARRLEGLPLPGDASAATATPPGQLGTAQDLDALARRGRDREPDEVREPRTTPPPRGPHG